MMERDPMDMETLAYLVSAGTILLVVLLAIAVLA